jgi:dienelactone hydrolase
MAAAQVVSATEPGLAADLHEEIQHIPVTVADLYGRQETRQIPVTVYTPDGAGPHPLVIMNHGRATQDKRAQQGRQRYEALARYLVGKGLAVMVPTRVGYWETYGDFDPEDSGNCNSMRVDPMAKAASDQVLATLAYARSRPDINASRWVVMGQSVGGLTAVATVARNPEGLVGGINFSGGTGGDPEHRAGMPCGVAVIARTWEAQAKEARVPMLWLYWANDQYWGESNPNRWQQAWTSGGGQVEFHSLAASGKDGHNGLNADMDHWVPLVEAFFSRLGFTRSGVPVVPPVNPSVRIEAADAVPISEAARESFYRKFLDSRPPRAFAIGPAGNVGWATGDWAVGRALGYCQARKGLPCKLYAVDDQVVWAR